MEATNTQNINADPSPIAVVQRLYDAFGQGNLPALLQSVSEDTHWTYIGANPSVIKQEFIGREGVQQFIRQLLERVTITAFEPQEFYSQQDTVIVFGTESGIVKQTGIAFTDAWAQKYVIKQGLITQMVEYNLQTQP